MYNKKIFSRPSRGGQSENEQVSAGAQVELRFAYSLLEKLIQYLDRATINMKLLKPSSTFSRRTSFKTSTRDIKFFSKVNQCPALKYSMNVNVNYCLGRASIGRKILFHA